MTARYDMLLDEIDYSSDLSTLECGQSFELNSDEESQTFEMEARDVVVVDNVKRVRVEDIVDNLTTDDPKKPLSAAQGVVLDGKLGQLSADLAEADEEILRAANAYASGLFAQIPEPDVETPVRVHNVAEDAHSDIRAGLEALVYRLNALANSDDETLDQMAEVVDFIKDNRGLIEQITTGKVSVADIVNNLTTNIANRPLSAAQGVALKNLIDALDKELDGKMPTSARQSIISAAFWEVEDVHMFRAYNSPVHFGLNDSNSLTAIVSWMPNNCDCDFWINDSQFYNVYKEISQRAKAEGATDGYGTVIIRKRNSLANVEWRHYKSMLTLGRRWTATNDKGWAGDWVVLVTADGKPQGGYTPVKGKDYWTAADKTEIVSEVGAVSAPAGFGLGSESANFSFEANPDNITKTGWYCCYGNGFGYSLVEHIQRDSDTAVQDWYLQSSNTTDGHNVLCRRTKENGVWGEFEWDNPPMNLGVEYRTTERIGGKAVYKRNNNGVVEWSTDQSTWHTYAAQMGAAPASAIASGAKTVYVAKTGNDSTGNGSASNPYLTIQKAVNSLPRVSAYSYNIIVKEGNYDELVTVRNFVNGTQFNISAASGETVRVKAMTMDACDSFFSISGIEFVGTTEDGYNHTLLVDTCRGAYLNNVTCVNTVESQHFGAIRFNLTPTVKLHGCTISNKVVALDVNASTVYLNDACTGTGNTVAIRCGSGWGQAGGFVQKAGSTIAGTETTGFGGQIF